MVAVYVYESTTIMCLCCLCTSCFSISDTISIFVCLPFIQSLSFSVNVQYNVADHGVTRQLDAKELEHRLYGRAIHLHHTRV